jgi:hypothetical protein
MSIDPNKIRDILKKLNEYLPFNSYNLLFSKWPK